MKRFILTLFCFFASIFPSLSYAGDLPYSPPFEPLSPKIWGQGGGYTAVAQGYEALFTNPAGFGMENGKKGRSITIVSANPWFYSKPDRLLPFVSEFIENYDINQAVDVVVDQVTEGGFGLGTSLGIGYVGKGIGLGFIGVLDSYLYGQKILGAEGFIQATFGFIGGLSYSFDIKKTRLIVGGDLRPMLRMYTPLENAAVLSMLGAVADDKDLFSVLNQQKSYSGIGLAFDLGFLFDFSPFAFGLSLRDVGGTKYRFNTATFEDHFGGLKNGSLPQGGVIDSEAVTPMDISAGIAFHPKLGSIDWLFDPIIQIEVQDITGMIRENRSFWTSLHGGADLRLLSLFNLRGGISQGYFTLGGGINLFFLELNAAIFTRELGLHAGDQPNAGVTFEGAVRF